MSSAPSHPNHERKLTSKSSQTDLVKVGQIVGAFGLKGLVKVQPMTDFLERFQLGGKLLLKGEWTVLESVSIHKGRPLIKFAGINNMTAAETLQWEYLEASGLPKLDEDTFLSSDLVGALVVTVEGEELGSVDEVMAYPAHDIFRVGELMIPVVKQFVTKIDLKKKRIVVRLIPGMRPGEE